MNTVQLHLMLNHIPVLGMLFGLAFFAYGIVRKNHDIQTFSLGAFVVLALVSVGVFYTGDEVAMLIEGIPGISDDFIAPHRTAASASFTAIGTLGVFALGGLVAFRRLAHYPREYLILVSALSIITMGLMGWTAHTGAQIHHAEISFAAELKHPQDGAALPYQPYDASEKE